MLAQTPEHGCSDRMMVRTERLELSHLAALEPKSSVSTNSTTSARVKQKRKRQARPGVSEYGVDDGNRTHDTRSHNPVLYQLSYAHHIALLVPSSLIGAPGRTRTCDHPLRRRMLYPAELRARLWLQPTSRIQGALSLLEVANHRASLCFRLGLCSSSGAHVIHELSPRQRFF